MLLEFNARFGDPETQVLMMRLISDPLPAMIAARDGVLRQVDLRWHADRGGMRRDGGERLSRRAASAAARSAASMPPGGDPAVKIFHAATRRDGRARDRRWRARPRHHRARRAISPKRATAPTPRSTGSTGRRASAAATSDDSWLGRCGSAGGEGDFDAAERAEIGGDMGAVPGEDHAGPRSGGDEGHRPWRRRAPHQIGKLDERRHRIPRGAHAAVGERLAVLGDPHLCPRKIKLLPIRHRGTPDEPPIRKIVGEDRRPAERLKSL